MFTAVFRRHFDAKKAQFAASPQQVDRDFPVLVLDFVYLRQDLFLDELFGHVADHSLFFGKIFRRKHILGFAVLDQEASAFLAFDQFFRHTN